MRKIVINACYGGFSLSQELITELVERGCVLPEYPDDIRRDDPDLVTSVEAGFKGGLGSNLVVIEIPDDVKWRVEEYDGLEWIAEKHRTWRAYV